MSVYKYLIKKSKEYKDMEIFTKLGIDSTLFIQIAIFLVVYSIMHFLVFKPLFELYKHRETLVLGNQEDKEQKLAEIKKIKDEYESKLRKLHGQIQGIFIEVKSEATEDCSEKLLEAKRQVKNTITETRKQRQLEQQDTKEKLEKGIPQLASMAIDKILNR